jgi:hypothetical protein
MLSRFRSITLVWINANQEAVVDVKENVEVLLQSTSFGLGRAKVCVPLLPDISLGQ